MRWRLVFQEIVGRLNAWAGAKYLGARTAQSRCRVHRHGVLDFDHQGLATYQVRGSGRDLAASRSDPKHDPALEPALLRARVSACDFVEGKLQTDPRHHQASLEQSREGVELAAILPREDEVIGRVPAP